MAMIDIEKVRTVFNICPVLPEPAIARHRGDALGAYGLERDGKVGTIGSPTFPASEIVEAQWMAEDRGLARFRTMTRDRTR